MSRLGLEALIHACSPPAAMSSPGHRSADECNLDVEYKLREIITNNNDEGLRRLCNQGGLQGIVRKFDNGSILHFAVRQGAVKCLQVLLNYDIVKAEIEAPDDQGRTALLVAVVSAQSEALEKLLRAGANVNARDDDHYGVLHLLVLELSQDNKEENEREHLMKVADLLLPISHEDQRPFPLDTLDLEPHANLAGQEDATPLSAAATILQRKKTAPWFSNILELCKKLIKVGASYSKREENIFKRAIKFDDLGDIRKPPKRALVLKLIDEVCRDGDILQEELRSMSKDALKEAVNSWVGQQSLLFWAVDKNNLEMVDMLLGFDAEPRMGCKLPIMVAAEKGIPSVFELLLDKMKCISADEKNCLIHILKDKETDGHNECRELIQDL